MKVIWSDRALRSLAAIHAHISADSEANAHRVIDRILKRGDQLSNFPLSGRIVPHPRRKNIRELIEQPTESSIASGEIQLRLSMSSIRRDMCN